MRLRISTSVPSASAQWVMSSCQRSLGWAACEAEVVALGRLCGCGVTNPRAVRIRQIVLTAGAVRGVRCRWNAMVAAPASWPAGELLADLDDLVLDRGSGLAGTARGRRERGSRPASPSARYRCTSMITQRRDTP